MEFSTFTNFVNEINNRLGIEFCREFQYWRRDIKGAGRAANSTQLFGNIHDDEDERWAINQGGGTEIQYHVSMDDDAVYYGLGFNALYVPYTNDKLAVDHIRPFMNAFLKKEAEITNQLPDYSFVYESRDQLLNPQNGHFTLFGKAPPILWNEDNFVFEDALLDQLIQDLKRQLPAYKLIFSQKLRDIQTMANIDEIIKLLVNNKPQIILQGPPGTGKTFTAKDVAEKMITGNVSPVKTQQQKVLEGQKEQFKLVQFHPAYSYEDFVRGITANATDDGISYETENKVLAKFAESASKNWEDSNKSSPDLLRMSWFKGKLTDYTISVQKEIEANKKFFLAGSQSYLSGVFKNKFTYYSDEYGYYPDDHEITFKELARIFLNTPFDENYDNVQLPKHTQFRKLLIPLLKDFRAFVGTIPDFATSTETVALKTFVLIVDEINRANLPAVLGELIYALEYRGEKVTSMYEYKGESEITLPPNLYIIGTMNTADRSVGHIDYAIRRRFAFVDVLPTNEPIKTFAKPLFKAVSELFITNYDVINWVEPKPERSDFVASDFRPEDIWIGHSYFITKEDGDNGRIELKFKLKYEIIPILKEYLKDGLLQDSKEEKVIDKINNLYAIVP